MRYRTLTQGEKQYESDMREYFSTHYGFTFHEPFTEKVPYISPLFLDSSLHSIGFRSAEALEEYMLSSYIVDMGTNDSKAIRNILVNEMHDEEEEVCEWIFNANKLRVNISQQKPLSGFGIFETLLKDNSFSIETDEYYSKNYSQLSFQEKISYAQFIDHQVYKNMERLYSHLEELLKKEII